MDCGICEHNAVDCECTNHEQSAYQKGRSEAQAEIVRLQAALARTEQNRDDILNDLHTAWNDAIEAAAKKAAEKLNKASQYRLSQSVSDAVRALRRDHA